MSGDFAVVPSNTTSAPSPFLSGSLQPSGAAPYFGDGSLYGGLLHKPFDGKGASLRVSCHEGHQACGFAECCRRTTGQGSAQRRQPLRYRQPGALPVFKATVLTCAVVACHRLISCRPGFPLRCADCIGTHLRAQADLRALAR